MLPLLGAALVMLAKAFLKGRMAAGMQFTAMLVGLFGPWLALLYTFPLVWSGLTVEGVIGNWSGVVGITFQFDGLAWLINALGYTVAGAAWIYSLGAGPRGPVFSSVFLIQTAALAATAMTADIFNLFVCLEVLGIASYVLVASSEKNGAFLASFSYLMVSASSMVFFLAGLFGLYRLTGSLSYSGISQALLALPDQGGGLAAISLSLIIAAVAMRVAMMPLYGWLPDAHALAPHAVSAVLSGVLIKTPLFALSRIMLIVPLGAAAAQLLGYAGAATAIVAVLVALSQKDAKRLLAYHSISQIGYVVCAWGAALDLGMDTMAGQHLMTAAFLHAFYHALFKGLLFLSIGTSTDRAGSRNVYTLRGAASTLRQSGERLPITLLSFIIAALAISAIPPLNGYASKIAITYSLKGSWQYWVLSAASIGTIASFIKLSRIFWPQPARIRLMATEEPSAVFMPSVATARHSGLPAQIVPGPMTDTSAVKRANLPVGISQAMLALACVASGLAAPWLYGFVLRLLDSAASLGFTSLNPGPALYTADNLLKTLYMVLAGFVLFRLAVSALGSRLLSLVRDRHRGFHGLFLSFAVGLSVLCVWLLLV